MKVLLYDYRNIEKQYDPKMADVEQKRGKLFFNNILGHLKRAKNTLEKEKDFLDKQSQVQKKIKSELRETNKTLLEEEVTLIFT